MKAKTEEGNEGYMSQHGHVAAGSRREGCGDHHQSHLRLGETSESLGCMVERGPE